MNPFEIFDSKEISKVSKVVGELENRNYTNDEWCKIENNILEDIMNNSHKNGDIDRARDNFNGVLNKIETCREKTDK